MAIHPDAKTPKNDQNKDKIIIIEKGGWAEGHKTVHYTNNINDQEYRHRCQLIENEYKKWIYKIENNIPLEGEEINWPTTIYKFGFENGYITLFELVNPEITRKIFKS